MLSPTATCNASYVCVGFYMITLHISIYDLRVSMCLVDGFVNDARLFPAVHVCVAVGWRSHSGAANVCRPLLLSVELTRSAHDTILENTHRRKIN